MVFSSVPAYPDPPIWPHHHQQQSEGGVDQENGHVPPVLPLPPLLARGGGGDGGGGTACTDASKPGSMSNRAKLAKLPQLPDTALKCPRCDSTNTKFCYFNNYNLSQPRHFCKTCRRYWTRGGALRNVPVGGGCRRNKRSKTGSRSKSPATSSASISAILTPNSSCTRDHNLCHLTQLPPPKLPFLPSSLHLTDYGLFEGIQNAKYGNTTAGNDIDHLIQIGSSSTSSYSNGKFSENWRMHQSHLLETPSPNTAGGMYQFEMSEEGLSNYGGTVTSDYLGSRTLESGVRQQQVVVDGLLKMEDSNYQGLNLSKKLLGISGTEDQYSWAGINSHAWSTNASEFASSSASHVL